MHNRAKQLLLLFLKNRSSFTLVELLIVITLLSILIVGGISQYYNSVKSGRDARRKADLQAIQRALELYYQDKGSYPIGSLPEPPEPFCHPNGCQFAVYIQTLPQDPSGTPYVYESDAVGSYYRIYSCIENQNDNGPGVNQFGYVPSCGVGRCNPCRFGLSSTNTTP